jgi:hypothetical protein
VLSPTATAPPTEALAPDALDALPDVALLVLDAELRIVSAAGGALERDCWPAALVEGRRLADIATWRHTGATSYWADSLAP